MANISRRPQTEEILNIIRLSYLNSRPQRQQDAWFLSHTNPPLPPCQSPSFDNCFVFSFPLFPQTQREGKKCFEFGARTSNEHRVADRRNVIPLSANRPKSRASGFQRKQGGSSLEKKCCLSSNTSCVRDREGGCYVFVSEREREREAARCFICVELVWDRAWGCFYRKFFLCLQISIDVMITRWLMLEALIMVSTMCVMLSVEYLCVLYAISWFWIMVLFKAEYTCK